MEHPWTRYYDHGVPAHIDYPDLTLPAMFETSAREYAGRVATVFHSKCVTYGQMWQQIRAFAAGLHGLGIGQGDRIALELPNVPQFVVAYFGALLAGAVVVPTNPLYTQHELEHQLTDAGVTAMVTLDQLFPRVQTALPMTDIRAVILTDPGEALPGRLRAPFALKQRRAGVRTVPPGGIVHRFADLLRTRPDGPILAGDARSVAVLQYTGGTTGTSMGAMLTHRNLVVNAVQAYHWQDASPDKPFAVLCPTPFFHVYGMSIGMNFAVRCGATMLLVPRWDARQVAHLAQKYRPEMFPGVPTMYLALSRLPDFSRRHFGSLRICISGAAPLPAEVRRSFEAASGGRLVEGYGLTEASPVTHCNPVFGEVRPGSVGIPFPDTDAAITDPETWERLPPGTVGEMTVRGPQVMAGYWKRPEETLSILRDGWLHTGDMAIMDVDGYFRIVDRKKDVIIAGGYNVYPREVEDVLYQHPKVLEAAVVGAPNEYRGETVKAVVVLRPGCTSTQEEVIAYCRQELAAYKVPKIVEFRADLPKSLIGKVLKRSLREEDVLPDRSAAG